MQTVADGIKQLHEQIATLETAKEELNIQKATLEHDVEVG